MSTNQRMVKVTQDFLWLLIGMRFCKRIVGWNCRMIYALTSSCGVVYIALSLSLSGVP